VGLSATGVDFGGWHRLCIGSSALDLSQFPVKDREKVKLSVSVVLIFAAIAFLLIATTGVWGFAKFCCCLGWFTILDEYIYAGSPYKSDVPFHAAEQWQEASAQLSGTVHCDYPWVEVLAMISMFTSPSHFHRYPSYNLRLAHRSLQQNWGLILMINVGLSWS